LIDTSIIISQAQHQQMLDDIAEQNKTIERYRLELAAYKAARSSFDHSLLDTQHKIGEAVVRINGQLERLTRLVDERIIAIAALGGRHAARDGKVGAKGKKKHAAKRNRRQPTSSIKRARRREDRSQPPRRGKGPS